MDEINNKIDYLDAILANIDMILEKKHWDRNELTYQTTLSSSTLSDWFSKKINPSFKNLVQICEKLEVSLSRLTAMNDPERLTAIEDEFRTVLKNYNEEEQVSILETLKVLAKAKK